MLKPGVNKVQKKYDTVRAACVEALVMVEQGESFDTAIKQAVDRKEFRAIDRRFFFQLVNGSIKMRRRLDHELKFFLAKPATGMSLILRNILRLGMYQLRFTDRIPAAAAVSEAVNLAHHMVGKRQASLVNAVLRASIREPGKVVFANKNDEPIRYLADFYSYPDYFVEYCVKEFGIEKAEKLLNTYNQPPVITYRVNFLKAKPDEVAHLLQENNIEFSFGKYLPEFLHLQSGGLPMEAELISSGKVYVQDESSGMAVRLLNPRPQNNVLDLTSAPGGKTTYMAIRMRNKGRVTALDKSRERLELVVENANRLGIKIISPVAVDMFQFSGNDYDRVLLDPPCSGWGTAMKHSDLRWGKSEEDIEKMTRIQSAMINRAAKLVKPGGVLVYSTCTIMRAETDQIVEEFLLRNREFEIESGREYFPEELVNQRGFVKTYPDCGHLDGSFCARLRRKVHV